MTYTTQIDGLHWCVLREKVSATWFGEMLFDDDPFLFLSVSVIALKLLLTIAI